MNSRSAFIFLAILVKMSMYYVYSQNIKVDRPNIILIMADDLGYETLGVYGGSSYKTPHLDRLANEGIRFDHCYSTPLCTPSRVQIMTGKYNFRNYIGFGLLDSNEKTFGHYMQQAGYKTYIAGKWQLLGSKYQQELAGNKIGTLPKNAGFDDYCLWQIDKIGSRYKDPKLSLKGKDAEVYKNKFGPDIFVEKIEEFMKENKDSPLFVYYPMVLTHDPFVPTPDNSEFKDFEANSRVNDLKYFEDMVAYMDKLIGRLVKTIDELGIRENTLIIFVGDNGTDRDVISIIDGVSLKGGKGSTNFTGTHVPLIVNWKGKIKSGIINDNLVDFTDFLPSIMEATNFDYGEIHDIDGLSFYPQLFSDENNTREWIYCHFNPNWNHFRLKKRYVHNKKWKLYGNGNFYDLENDPYEQKPLHIDNQMKEKMIIIEKFRKVLDIYNF